LEAFDLTGSLREAAGLTGCSHHTVGRYVTAREQGGLSDRPAARSQLIDGFRPKLGEWIERSNGKLRAHVAHDKLLALGFTGSECTTRRAVRRAKAAFKAGRVRIRVHRPWVTEPGKTRAAAVAPRRGLGHVSSAGAGSSDDSALVP
jgi:pyruvate/2-oxoacid:ferredoxin oxidoreductase alpha subunit